ncbi:f-box domain-containing protein [Colletotrichum incanum]|uniref:F-box domain-containing protein n=1 Tax=Colletotrichum incanum TaxID=1573173 RepID=A0A166L4N4_COLIC|nr:f-box domain-containing protein [Colletotrichum incanum]
MRLFRRFRPNTAAVAKYLSLSTRANRQGLWTHLSYDLPDTVLQDIMRCVCPHAQDRTYQSIRIDVVHYCPRETKLFEKRKHRGFLRSNADPNDVPTVRLGLLCRTLCEHGPRLGPLIKYLKLPYMLREAAGADLFRILHMLPNLRYVDLSSGLFADQHRYGTLRLAVEARCRDLRKMAYHGGAERSLAKLATSNNTWQNLEALELIRIEVAACVLPAALGLLENLRALKIAGIRSFSDAIFGHIDGSPPFPCLEEFVLRSTPAVTGRGLLDSAGHGSTVLTEPLAEILSAAHNLQTLAFEATVSKPLSDRANTQRLASTSLRKLRFELSTTDSMASRSRVIASHYRYLAESLKANVMPNLTSVYLLGEHLVHQLGLSYPQLAFPMVCNDGVLDPANTDETATSQIRSFPNDVVFRDLASSPPTALMRRLIVYTRMGAVADWPSESSRFSVPVGDQLVSYYGLDADVAGCGWGDHNAARQ